MKDGAEDLLNQIGIKTGTRVSIEMTLAEWLLVGAGISLAAIILGSSEHAAARVDGDKLRELSTVIGMKLNPLLEMEAGDFRVAMAAIMDDLDGPRKADA